MTQDEGGIETATGRSHATTPALLGWFFVFATAACTLAGLSLLMPGSPLDAIWRWKPDEHRQLLAFGPLLGMAFLALAVVMAAASFGTFARRRWGLKLAMAIFAANAIADAARLPFGAVWEGVIGIAVTGIILWWLAGPRIRRAFDR
jgi:hypothetical protein